MKAQHARRAVSLCLCLLACAVVVAAVSLGVGRAVSVAVADTASPFEELQMQLNPGMLQEIQGLGLNLEDLLDDPIVTDVEPNGGLTTGGTAVVITGTQFAGATAVTFGGTAAVFHVDSDTQITATTPAHAAGSVQVRVTTTGGSSPDTSADDYAYVAAPPTTATPTTATPTTGTPSSVTPTTATPTTAAPAATTEMVATTVAVDEAGGGLSSGWIAFIVVVGVIALGALGAMAYMLSKSGKKGGPAA